MRRVKNLEKRGPSQGIAQKCELQERNPWAPQFEERTQDETLKQERCARRDAWELAQDVYKLKKESKDSFYTPARAWVMPAPSSTKAGRETFRDRLWSSYAYVKYEGLAQESWRHSRDLDPTITVVTANGEVQTKEGAQVYVHDLHIFVTVQLLEDTPPVLSLGKLCKECGYTYECPSCSEPRPTKNGKSDLL